MPKPRPKPRWKMPAFILAARGRIHFKKTNNLEKTRAGGRDQIRIVQLRQQDCSTKPPPSATVASTTVAEPNAAGRGVTPARITTLHQRDQRLYRADELPRGQICEPQARSSKSETVLAHRRSAGASRRPGRISCSNSPSGARGRFITPVKALIAWSGCDAGGSHAGVRRHWVGDGGAGESRMAVVLSSRSCWRSWTISDLVTSTCASFSRLLFS